MRIVNSYATVRDGMASGDSIFAVNGRFYKKSTITGVYTVINSALARQWYVARTTLSTSSSPIPTVTLPYSAPTQEFSLAPSSGATFENVPVSIDSEYTPGGHPSGIEWQSQMIINDNFSTTIPDNQTCIGIKDGDMIRIDASGLNYKVGEVITGDYKRTVSCAIIDNSGNITYWQHVTSNCNDSTPGPEFTVSNIGPSAPSGIDVSAIAEPVADIFWSQIFLTNTFTANVGGVATTCDSNFAGTKLAKEVGHKDGIGANVVPLIVDVDGAVNTGQSIDDDYDGLTIEYIMPRGGSSYYSVVLAGGTFFFESLTVQTMHIYVSNIAAYFTATNSNKYLCLNDYYEGFSADYLTQIDPDLLFGEELVDIITLQSRIIFVTESGRYWTHTDPDAKEIREVFIGWGSVSASTGHFQQVDLDVSNKYIFTDGSGNKLFTAPTDVQAKRDLSGPVGDFHGSICVQDGNVYVSNITAIEGVDPVAVEYIETTNGLVISPA